MTLKRVNRDAIVEISGGTWNDIVERLERIAATPNRTQVSNGLSALPSIRNDTGADLTAFRTVEIGDPLPLPGTQDGDHSYLFQHVFAGIASSADTTKLGITMESIPSDIGGGQKGVGEIAITGVATAIIDVINVDHGYAVPSATAGILESTDVVSSVVIIFSPASTGEQQCKVLLGGGVNTGDSKPNGFFNCCTCANSELHVSIEGDGITWEHVRDDLWPVKSSDGLLHKIILTSDDDPSVTRDIELPLVDCAEIDCQTQGMTGEFVGTREIESIIFGNSATCSVFCDPTPAISYLEETFAALPASPWSISLAESSVASNVMTFTAQDSFGAAFKPAVATQVFHMLMRFRILSDSMQITVKGIDYTFADDGSWSASSGGGSVVNGIGTPGATVELLIVDNVVTIDGSASKDLSASTLSGSCGTAIDVLIDTDAGFPPVVGTDVAEIDVLEVGWR